MKATIKTEYSRTGEWTLDTDDGSTVGEMCEIHDSLEGAMENCGFGYGFDLVVLTKEELQKIMNGETLVVDGGEYMTYVVCKETVK